MIRIGGSDTTAHYERLAKSYDDNWSHSAPFLAWMTQEIVGSLRLTRHDRIADVGCGTGLFTQRVWDLVRPTVPILCVDPSEAMLAQLPTEPGLLPVHASAEQFASRQLGPGQVDLTTEALDAVVAKEALHHVAPVDRARVVAGIAGLLSSGGRFLVVMLPTRIEYPLFAAALGRFEELQPDPATIGEHMTDAGLTVNLSYRDFPLEIPKSRYLAMVRSRYMSLLSIFDDDEIEAGACQIERDHPEETLSFRDRFAFVLGARVRAES